MGQELQGQLLRRKALQGEYPCIEINIFVCLQLYSYYHQILTENVSRSLLSWKGVDAWVPHTCAVKDLGLPSVKRYSVMGTLLHISKGIDCLELKPLTKCVK